MRKANATYSNRTRRKPAGPAKAIKKPRRAMPRWMPYAATITFALALCLTVNFRAFTDLNREIEQHENLNTEIEKITSENLNLQEEIYYLQHDEKVIEREAKKFGFRRHDKEKKVSVPAAK
ncbi:MAG TPA: hypothetical protein VFZ23_14535 [Pyrinomonadaceae bacterium]